MPFKSAAQRKWMHANEPEMADRWEKHTPKGKKLPEHVAKSESLIKRIDQVLSGESKLRLGTSATSFEQRLNTVLECDDACSMGRKKKKRKG